VIRLSDSPMENDAKAVGPGSTRPWGRGESRSTRPWGSAETGTAFQSRRSFLGWLLGVCTASVGALLAVPLVRFALHPLLAKTTETSWSDLGAVGGFASLTSPVRRLITIEQRDGWRKAVFQKAVYVAKQADGRLIVLSPICPHLGCSVAWNEVKGQFICPCHAGAFGLDGKRISGPPPRGMDTLETTVKDGRLVVRYQYFRQLVPVKEVMA
jgi:quinol---cytochrome c reductase iron-sulfur subunit, bacillus type